MDLKTLLNPVSADLLQVNEVIRRRLSSQVSLINDIGGHIIHAGGKRLRPATTLLAAGAAGRVGPDAHILAAVIEFIHTATLLHDDVVDRTDLRRGRITANAQWSNSAAVLSGDFLYSRAFQMMVDSASMRVMEILAEATNVIAEGEVLQLMNMHDASLDEAGYLRVIQSKTAKLFEASARLAAILAGSDARTEQACATYGQALGTAFQVIDDVLDYEGDAAVMGKNLGDDLREGKRTVIIATALDRATESQATVVRTHLGDPALDDAGLEALRTIICDTGALAFAEEQITLRLDEALAAVERENAKRKAKNLPQLGCFH